MKKFIPAPAILLIILIVIANARNKSESQPENQPEITASTSAPAEAEAPAGTTTLQHEMQANEALSKSYELPRPTGRSTDFVVTHRTEDGKITYSLEYDSERYHARWVAFTFDRESSVKNVKRTDAWSWDPQLPSRLNTETLFRGSGYSRGHLVASEDRAYSTEANAQTFYYSNMSPQLQDHNGGIWARLENKVQAWGRDNRLRDVLYVAKGGTIADGQIEPERVKGKIVVPLYYWMALLSERNGEYHSIAFLTEHRKYEHSESNLQQLALSVNELEKFIGIDLFYNLPEDIQRRVEAERPDSPTARRYWWR